MDEAEISRNTDRPNQLGKPGKAHLLQSGRMAYKARAGTRQPSAPAALRSFTPDDDATAPAMAPVSALTSEDWKLILNALEAYQHHAGFRAVYEKLTRRQTPS